MLKSFAKSQTQGFTLVELIIAVIIIGVLFSIAVPTYIKTVERSRAANAKTRLNFICDAEKIYNTDTTTYTTSFPPLLLVNEGLVTDDGLWAYTLPSATTSLFTAQANRKSGKYTNYKILIDQNSSLSYQDASGGAISTYPP